MADIKFPDVSSQEEMIDTEGDAELLYKRGEKILRYKKSIWGREGWKDNYTIIKPQFSGRVVNMGLGMGNSVDTILENETVTEVISYEYVADIANLYIKTHDADSRHTIKIEDGYSHKPDGLFNSILFEPILDSQDEFDKAEEYLSWAEDHLYNDGSIIMNYDEYMYALAIQMLPDMTVVIESLVEGRKPKNLFIKCIKVQA